MILFLTVRLARSQQEAISKFCEPGAADPLWFDPELDPTESDARDLGNEEPNKNDRKWFRFRRIAYLLRAG